MSDNKNVDERMVAAFVRALKMLRPWPAEKVRAFTDALTAVKPFPEKGSEVSGYPEVGFLPPLDFMAHYYVGVGIAYPERMSKLGLHYMAAYNAALAAVK